MPVPKKRKGEDEDAFISRCMGNATMKKDFPDRDQRLAVCFDSFRANKEATPGLFLDGKGEGKIVEKYFEVRAQAEADLQRTESFKGEEHLVVPVIALVEGVIHPSNAPAPELALASEFGKHPAAWNGRPLVVNHPVLNGKPVSANIPEVLDTEEIGQIFNSSVVDGKLRVEAWINLARVEEMGGVVKETIDKVRDNEVVEVSTGLLVNLEETKGRFNGEDFDGIWRDAAPDHLAILSSAKGACSVEDGCGLNRVNEDVEGTSLLSKIRELLLPQTPTDCGAGCDCSECTGTRATLLESFVETLRLSAKDRSDTDTRNAIQAALDAKGGDEGFAFVVSVFSEKFIVQTFDGLFEQSFSIDDDGTVNLGDERTQVRPETEFVPVRTNDEEDDMDKTELVAALISNEQSQFKEDDRESLMALDEALLEKMVPPEVDPEEAAKKAAEEEAQAKQNAEAEAAAKAVAEGGETRTLEEVLAEAPPELQDVLNEGIRSREAHRANLIAGITANAQNTFSEAELKAMSTESLEKTASLAKVTNFVGRGGPRAPQPVVNEQLTVPKPKEVFPGGKSWRKPDAAA